MPSARSGAALPLWLAIPCLLVVAGCSESDDTAGCDGVSCSSRGFCLTESGRPYCACMTGYHPIGLACLANDVSDPCAGIDCAGHGTCRTTGPEVTCDCAPGYGHVGADDPRCALELECDLFCVRLAPGDGGADDADDAMATDDTATDADASSTDTATDADASSTDTATDADDAEVTPDVGACPNGFLDPGEECDGNTTACGDCDLGTRTCTASCTWGTCEWRGTCHPGDSEDCGDCNLGTRTCRDDCNWDGCDWDGTCHPGDSQSCGSGCTTNCTSSCWFGACLCDSSSRSCTTADGCPGTQSCTSGGSSCSWSTCSAPASCRDHWGDVYCSGQTSTSATTSGCGVQCKTCTCSAGSWVSCGSCHVCPA